MVVNMERTEGFRPLKTTTQEVNCNFNQAYIVTNLKERAAPV